MAQEMLRIVDAIARDRNVEKEVLFRDIEQAMVSAARKHFGTPESEDFTCSIDRLNGEITVFQNGEKVPLETLGRIPAQTAKQVMIQKFREDERSSIYDEFADRVGEIVTGSAQRYEGGALVVQIGRAEGFMPRSEQIPGEMHQPGERVRCLILDVRETSNQVKIVLSRGHVEFIRRLFEIEVPEVQERIIEIKSVAREPGHRSKVAVSSIDSKVDAVGACVGVRGSRIKNIVDELGGEKIDIVRWNESSQVLIANALRPAEVVEISLCFELSRATVVVNEDQLSLAIGKRGQNVRLAARLTGWDVDILTPVEFSKGLEIMGETLRAVDGISDEILDRIAALGLISVDDVVDVGADVLVEQLGELGMDQPLAERVMQICGEKAKEVAAQKQLEKQQAEADRLKAQQEAASSGDADTDAQVAAILGDMGGHAGDPPPPAATAPSEAETDAEAEGEPQPQGIMDENDSDILAMLKSRATQQPDVAVESAPQPTQSQEDEVDSPFSDSTDEPLDLALAREQSQADHPQPESPASQEIDQSPDESDIARLAEGTDDTETP